VGQRAAALGHGVTADDRVAFVTGASRGIGRATAVALGAAGHPVAFCYSSDAEGAAETVRAVESTGARAMALRAAVEDPAAVDAAFAEVEAAWGPVAVLVNNAGVNRDGLVMRMGDDQWSEVLQVDLTGAFHTIRRATPKMMRARYGRIVNVSSVSAHIGSPGQANYAAAKAGLLGLSRSVARELGSRGITCNVVAPGPIVTAMTEAMGEEWLSGISAVVPLGRAGDPEECAAVIAFLCSESAGYVTGALVPVDGGMSMGI
jgi:NAD(P)-dependent dehydrogenase (short-subunit alcohol dehydrogenase family)